MLLLELLELLVLLVLLVMMAVWLTAWRSCLGQWHKGLWRLLLLLLLGWVLVLVLSWSMLLLRLLLPLLWLLLPLLLPLLLLLLHGSVLLTAGIRRRCQCLDSLLQLLEVSRLQHPGNVCKSDWLHNATASAAHK